jgi:putative ABC transport system permease protein
LIGGAAGIFVAAIGVRALVAMAPAGRIPRLEEVSVDGLVLTCTMAVALLTGLVFGVVPALIGSRREPREALANGVRTVVGPQGALRRSLVSAEIALALILLTGAGLMVKSFVRMRTVDTGYRAERVHTLVVDLPRLSYPNAERIHGFHGAMLEQLAALPGTVAVGAVSFRPMSGRGIMGNFTIDGGETFRKGYLVDKPTVSAGYFGAMGIRVLHGRDFTDRDNSRAPGVVVISESVARTVWPGQNAVGKRISMRDKPQAGDWLTVVGVVNDVMQDAELTRRSTVYLPYLQTSSMFFIDHMTFVVRSDATARNVGTAMRTALRRVDPTVPAQSVQSMDDVMLTAIAEPLFQTRLITVFSLLALVLAIVGTYGVLAYDVAERTREISLRMALGATSGDVMRAVLGQTSVLALIGAIIGVLGSLALSRVLTKSLFEVTPTDPQTMIGAVVLIVISALAAGYIPARRATRVEALSALSRG